MTIHDAIGLWDNDMSEQESIRLGAKIQNARKKSGKDICAISEEICVSKSYLIAIEEGRFDALPAFPFAIGFVRAFAHEVGMEAGDIAFEFKEIVRPVEVEEESPEQEGLHEQMLGEKREKVKRGPIYGSMAVVLSVLSASWMIFVGGQQATYVESTPQNNSVEYADTALQVAAIEVTVIEESDSISDTIDMIEEAFAPAGNQLMGVAIADEAGAADLMTEATEVMFEARQDAWVRISSEDAVLFEGVLHAGDHYVPPMGPALSLTTSNAGGLALHIGDHDLGVLGAKGAIIEGVKIDPDSLILRLVETL